MTLNVSVVLRMFARGFTRNDRAQQAAIVAVAFEGRSVRAAAEASGLSKSTVSRLVRGFVAQLRAAAGAEGLAVGDLVDAK